MAKKWIKCLAFIVIFGCVLALAKPVFAARIHVVNRTNEPIQVMFELRTIFFTTTWVEMDLFGNADRVWENYLDWFSGNAAVFGDSFSCDHTAFSDSWFRFYATVVMEKDAHSNGVKCTFTFR